MDALVGKLENGFERTDNSVKANVTAFLRWRSFVAGGGSEPRTFRLCDLTHLLTPWNVLRSVGSDG